MSKPLKDDLAEARRIAAKMLAMPPEPRKAKDSPKPRKGKGKKRKAKAND